MTTRQTAFPMISTWAFRLHCSISISRSTSGLLLSRGDWSTFMTRPLSAGLLIAAALMIVVVMLPSIKAKREEAFQEED